MIMGRRRKMSGRRSNRLNLNDVNDFRRRKFFFLPYVITMLLLLKALQINICANNLPVTAITRCHTIITSTSSTF